MSQFVNANGNTLLNLKFSLKEQETGMQWIDGKKIYLMFWAYLEGSEDKKSKVRKVEYTLYRE